MARNRALATDWLDEHGRAMPKPWQAEEKAFRAALARDAAPRPFIPTNTVLEREHPHDS